MVSYKIAVVEQILETLIFMSSSKLFGLFGEFPLVSHKLYKSCGFVRLVAIGIVCNIL